MMVRKTLIVFYHESYLSMFFCQQLFSHLLLMNTNPNYVLKRKICSSVEFSELVKILIVLHRIINDVRETSET